MLTNRNRRSVVLCTVTTALAGFSLSVVGCDKTTSESKTKTTKTEDTPEGKKTTTETHEKTVEKEKK
jgi:hypothetical protein